MFFKNANENTVFRLKSLTQSVILGTVIAIFTLELAFIYKLGVEEGIVKDPMQKTGYINIAQIEISNEITDQTAKNFIEKLEAIRYDDNYEQVLVIINSGGGSPTASDEIANYLVDFQKDKKVTLYVQSIATSGAYYIASSVKPIYANPNAIVGSIGVIMPHYVIADVAHKVGIIEDHITEGKYKVPVSMFKKATQEDKAYLSNNLLNPVYENFKAFVAKHRGVSLILLEPYTEGRIFAASMPEIKGILVDEIINETSLKNKIQASLSEEFKVDKKEVVFVNLDTKKKADSFFNVNVNLNADKILESANLRFQ